MFITRYILNETRDSVFSADDRGVSGVRANSKRIKRLHPSENNMYIYIYIHNQTNSSKLTAQVSQIAFTY